MSVSRPSVGTVVWCIFCAAVAGYVWFGADDPDAEERTSCSHAGAPTNILTVKVEGDSTGEIIRRGRRIDVSGGDGSRRTCAGRLPETTSSPVPSRTTSSTEDPETIASTEGAGTTRSRAGRAGIDWWGGPGPDTITSRDSSSDVVSCGPGNDSVKRDARDEVSGCERGGGG